jgi:hypothetical protein
MRKTTFVVACILLLAVASLAEKKPESQYSELTFSVVKADTGAPVRNASVILHPVTDKGKQSSGGFQLKTDSEGKTFFNGVPYGKLRIQVLARGLQTFGQDYDINQPKHEFVIKLKRPQEQYSIYK